VCGQPHTPATLTTGERPPGTHWVGGWVAPRGSRTFWRKEKSLAAAGIRNPNRPAWLP